MAALLKIFSPSYWFPSDAVAQAEALVKARTEPLKKNTEHIVQIAETTERVITLHKTIKTDNPTLYATLNAPSQETISPKEMGELIQLLKCATVTNLQELREEFDKLDQADEGLDLMLAKCKEAVADLKKAVESGRRAQTLDEKNIEDLTELQRKVQNLGLSPSCHTDSVQ